MKAILLLLIFSTASFAQDRNVSKKNLRQFREQNMILGYADGLAISLRGMQASGRTKSELYKLNVDYLANLTSERAGTEEQILELKRSIISQAKSLDCLPTLGKLGEESRGLGFVKGLEMVTENNEELISQRYAEAHLKEKMMDLYYKSEDACLK